MPWVVLDSNGPLNGKLLEELGWGVYKTAHPRGVFSDCGIRCAGDTQSRIGARLQRPTAELSAPQTSESAGASPGSRQCGIGNASEFVSGVFAMIRQDRFRGVVGRTAGPEPAIVEVERQRPRGRTRISEDDSTSSSEVDRRSSAARRTRFLRPASAGYATPGPGRSCPGRSAWVGWPRRSLDTSWRRRNAPSRSSKACRRTSPCRKPPQAVVRRP